MLALDQEPLSCGFILSGLRRSIDNLELEFARFLDRDRRPDDHVRLVRERARLEGS